MGNLVGPLPQPMSLFPFFDSLVKETNLGNGEPSQIQEVAHLRAAIHPAHQSLG